MKRQIGLKQFLVRLKKRTTNKLFFLHNRLLIVNSPLLTLAKKNSFYVIFKKIKPIFRPFSTRSVELQLLTTHPIKKKLQPH